MGVKIDVPTHGTSSGYRRGCRCRACRTAKSLEQQRYTARRAEREKAEVAAPLAPPVSEIRRDGTAKAGRTHGRKATYDRGCRCTGCTTAKRTADRRYRARTNAANNITALRVAATDPATQPAGFTAELRLTGSVEQLAAVLAFIGSPVNQLAIS